jgi:formate dehydrogenase iron-sulfur subunit
MHCTNAPCVDVCPTRALKYHPLGVVTLEQDLCNGCGYCLTACPFNIPRLETDVLTGRGKATKCNLCQDRVTNGLMPACAKTCPPGAIRFGARGEMLKLGRARVGALRERGFAEANLYGEDLLGGTGRMYVLAMSPDSYDLPVRPTYPLLVKFWQRVFHPLGELAVVGTILGLAANWFLTRRLRGKKQEEV